MPYVVIHVLSRCLRISRYVSEIPTQLRHNLSYFSSQALNCDISTSWNLHKRAMSYTTTERGTLNSQDYRVFFSNGKHPISPFHDIPIFPKVDTKIYNMVVEVPRWTNAKMEIATKEPLNPIKQDTKKGKLRFVKNCFPHHGYIWNYGAIPQTWENPNKVDESTSAKGDNDPIDVCEIGYRVAKCGDILQVKILGIMALIDEGETDWKVIAIDVNDPLANELNDIEDVEKNMPGLLRATHEWFRIYKIPDGNAENKFAFNGEPKNKEFAEKIVDETHKQWKELILNKVDPNGLVCSTVTVENSPFKIGVSDAEDIISKQPEVTTEIDAIDPIVNKWHYVNLK